ncbi:MAG: relaxase/mobilization nuclease domain-containing protein, partial [Firmicutes bacterium]|nr:relaxase/mobilization nuclease domain-containing protein [Bacillota bacterium]
MKIVPIKQSTHLDSVINYIKNPDKTEQMLYVTGFMCSPDTVNDDFKPIFDKAMKKGNNLAHHIMIGFSPDDVIDQETAIEVAQELMKQMYPNNQYVLAIHNDREHLHCHIIVNAVDFKNYKKIHSNIHSLNEMRDICDNLCRERGLQVIDKNSRKNKSVLRKAIDENIDKAAVFDDFIKIMQQSGYEVKISDYLYFKGKNDTNFRRSDTMGYAYSIQGIEKRLQGIDVPRGKKRIYGDKTIRISNRRRLKFAIDDMLKAANSYEELLELLKAEGIEIKQ